VPRRGRRDVGGKQNRMDEARDDRLRQQQRERWEHQKDNEAASAEGNCKEGFYVIICSSLLNRNKITRTNRFNRRFIRFKQEQARVKNTEE